MIGRMFEIGTTRIFIHLGGSNIIPLSYVDNCADAIVLAGIKQRGSEEIFNVVDDDLPTSSDFLKYYTQEVKKIKSIYIPYKIFYIFCYLWEKWSKLTKGQLPLKFNRKTCSNFYKGNRYSNAKLKNLLGWKPKINFAEGLNLYLEYQRGIEDRR
jgi:nucleoside-diphosphate-sugar epimerase